MVAPEDASPHCLEAMKDDLHKLVKEFSVLAAKDPSITDATTLLKYVSVQSKSLEIDATHQYLLATGSKHKFICSCCDLADSKKVKMIRDELRQRLASYEKFSSELEPIQRNIDMWREKADKSLANCPPQADSSEISHDSAGKRKKVQIARDEELVLNFFEPLGSDKPLPNIAQPLERIRDNGNGWSMTNNSWGIRSHSGTVIELENDKERETPPANRQSGITKNIDGDNLWAGWDHVGDSPDTCDFLFGVSSRTGPSSISKTHPFNTPDQGAKDEHQLNWSNCSVGDARGRWSFSTPDHTKRLSRNPGKPRDNDKSACDHDTSYWTSPHPKKSGKNLTSTQGHKAGLSSNRKAAPGGNNNIEHLTPDLPADGSVLNGSPS